MSFPNQGLFGPPAFFGQVPVRGFRQGPSFLGAPPPKPPPSESNPELAKKPYASTVDELCQLGRKQAENWGGVRLGERMIKVLRDAGENEDAVLEDLKNFCPDGFAGMFVALRELGERRRLRYLPRKPAQTGIPTPTSSVAPAPTPTPGSPYGKTPEGNVIFSPRTPQAPPTYPATATPGALPTSSLPTYMDVQDGRVPTYGTDLQRQVDSYARNLQEFSSRPRPYTDIYNTQPVATPSALRPAPSTAETSVIPSGCPPGQFLIDPMRPEKGCRGAVATGGLPGGFDSASVMPGTVSPGGMQVTNFAGMGRAFGGASFLGMSRPIRARRLGDMQSDIAWFEANRVSISQQFPGQWVIVRDQAVVGVYSDFQSAYGAGTAMFGSDPFVVKEARAEETPIRLVGRMP